MLLLSSPWQRASSLTTAVWLAGLSPVCPLFLPPLEQKCLSHPLRPPALPLHSSVLHLPLYLLLREGLASKQLWPQKVNFLWPEVWKQRSQSLWVSSVSTRACKAKTWSDRGTCQPRSLQWQRPQSCPAQCSPLLSLPPLSRGAHHNGDFLGPQEAHSCSDALSREQLALSCVSALSHHHQTAAVLSRLGHKIPHMLCALLQPQTGSCPYLLTQRQVQELGLQLMAECKCEFLHLGKWKRRGEWLHWRELVAETQSSILQLPKAVPRGDQRMSSTQLVPASYNLEGCFCAAESKTPEKLPPSSRDTSSNALSGED